MRAGTNQQEHEVIGQREGPCQREHTYNTWSRTMHKLSKAYEVHVVAVAVAHASSSTYTPRLCERQISLSKLASLACIWGDSSLYEFWPR